MLPAPIYIAEGLQVPPAARPILRIGRHTLVSSPFEKTLSASSSPPAVHAHLIGDLIIGETISSQSCGSALLVGWAFLFEDAHSEIPLCGENF
jgi:hypothetical protein